MRLKTTTLAAATLIAAAPALDPREAAIRTAMADLGRSWETGDRALAEPLYADNFVDIAMDGVQRDKAEVLAFIRPAATSATKLNFSPSDYRFVFHGDDLAVVTYRNQDCRERPEGRRCFSFRASETFRRDGGRWRLILGQQSRIPDDPADPGSALSVEYAAVRAVEAAMRDAQLRNDVAGIDTLLAGDWRMTLGDGTVVDKPKFLDDVRSFWKPTAIAYTEQAVEVLGEGAVVTGVARSDWIGKDGAPKSARERYTDVYARRYGAWRKLRTHLSCIEGSC